MSQDDNAPDLNAIAARYREMNETALMEEARAYDSLRSEVQPLLREEFARRGLEPPLVEDAGQQEFRELVTLATYSNLSDAILARSVLESAGIGANLWDENISSIAGGYNFAQGVRLQVEPGDAEAARTILAQQAPEAAGGID